MAALNIFSRLLGADKSVELKESLYDYTVKSIDGRDVHLSKYSGRPLLIVNTASNCGFTSQYAGLQALHEKYGDRFTILGFPSNNFMWQEPGSNKTIASFCALNYGVTFPMFEKIAVKGSNQHPLYQWLEVHAKQKPTWNFCKYLIDKKGNIAEFYPSKVEPLDPVLVNKILSLL